MFSSYKRLDCYSLLQHPLPGVEVHVVRAANSDRWSQKELQQLEELEKPSEQPKVLLPRHCSASCSASMNMLVLAAASGSNNQAAQMVCTARKLVEAACQLWRSNVPAFECMATVCWM